MEKQTSIDWFIDKLPIRMKNYLNEEIETARKMYKQDMENSFNLAKEGNHCRNWNCEGVESDVMCSFTFEDIKKAFNAGEHLVHHQWHVNEFHTSNCDCDPIEYNNFDDWVKQNYT